ncbi:nuclear transport factor 2-like protein [Bounagaea algeriensis]
MDDAVSRFRSASATNDVEGMIDTLTPDAELVSPLSGRMTFRGTEDLRILLAAVYGNLARLRWREEMGDVGLRVVIGEAQIGPLRLDDAMVLTLASDGRIQSIKPHLRPWLAVTFLALKLAPTIARHPGVVRRALQHR